MSTALQSPERGAHRVTGEELRQQRISELASQDPQELAAAIVDLEERFAKIEKNNKRGRIKTAILIGVVGVGSFFAGYMLNNSPEEAPGGGGDTEETASGEEASLRPWDRPHSLVEADTGFQDEEAEDDNDAPVDSGDQAAREATDGWSSSLRTGDRDQDTEAESRTTRNGNGGVSRTERNNTAAQEAAEKQRGQEAAQAAIERLGYSDNLNVLTGSWDENIYNESPIEAGPYSMNAGAVLEEAKDGSFSINDSIRGSQNVLNGQYGAQHAEAARTTMLNMGFNEAEINEFAQSGNIDGYYTTAVQSETSGVFTHTPYVNYAGEVAYGNRAFAAGDIFLFHIDKETGRLIITRVDCGAFIQDGELSFDKPKVTTTEEERREDADRPSRGGESPDKPGKPGKPGKPDSPDKPDKPGDKKPLTEAEAIAGPATQDEEADPAPTDGFDRDAAQETLDQQDSNQEAIENGGDALAPGNTTGGVEIKDGNGESTGGKNQGDHGPGAGADKDSNYDPNKDKGGTNQGAKPDAPVVDTKTGEGEPTEGQPNDNTGAGDGGLPE